MPEKKTTKKSSKKSKEKSFLACVHIKKVVYKHGFETAEPIDMIVVDVNGSEFWFDDWNELIKEVKAVDSRNKEWSRRVKA